MTTSYEDDKIVGAIITCAEPSTLPVFDVAQEILEPALAATRRDLERASAEIAEHDALAARARAFSDRLLAAEQRILAALDTLGATPAEDDR